MLNIVLGKRQRFTGRNQQLRFDEIDAGHHFRYRVFHLQARVHFQKVELAAVTEDELDRAGIRIARRGGDCDGRRTDFLAQRGVETGGRRLLDHFLEATLDGAVALAEVYAVPVLVGEDLDFDMARM